VGKREDRDPDALARAAQTFFQLGERVSIRVRQNPEVDVLSPDWIMSSTSRRTVSVICRINSPDVIDMM